MASRLIRFPWPMGVGTDICQVSRIQTILSCPTGRGRHFVRRILCEEELKRPSSKLKPYLRAVLKFATEHETLKQQGKEIEGLGHGHGKRLEQKWKGHGVDLGEVAAFMAGRFAAKEAAIKAHPHRHLTFHDIIIAKAAELDQIESELLQQGLPSSESPSASASGSGSGSKTFTGSATGPTTKVDPNDIMPEDQVFDYKLETDKPDGYDRPKSKSFTGSTKGPTTPVDTKDIMPEDQVFDYQLETDKPNGSNGSPRSRSFTGSTTGPTTPVDPRDVMPEDQVFDYKLETDKPDDTEPSPDTALATGRTTVLQEAPGRARLGSGPPVAIIRGAKKEESDHQVALISISHDGDYATATCVGFDAGSMVKGGMGWMVSR
ncbi:hypothetical protein QBC45DRAFT_438678 [Copromyces sp. CBS 386.78]|nr:hypothetical protein QBC45DRAFT_438678 [Copromyces sp. CBS 386.78]